MDKSCPYCNSLAGYYKIEQVKRKAIYTWEGVHHRDQDHKIFYQGKTMRCLACDEKVTSFALGLQREVST